MKRFLVFAPNVNAKWYEQGGWHDFRGDFDTETEAVHWIHRDMEWNCDWWQVIDSETRLEVDCGPEGGG